MEHWMNKGYTVEIIREENGRGIGSDYYHFKTKEEARKMMAEHDSEFSILTEWATFPYGLGNYEVEIDRHENW